MVINDFSAGTADLEEDRYRRGRSGSHQPDLDRSTRSLREPDGVAWISDSQFATADEGDLAGGSRGFTIYDKSGRVKFAAGNSVEHLAVRAGHYPDARSENKGNQPENVKFAKFGKTEYLFVASERSSLVFVYEMCNGKPVYKQTLPAGVAPEGLLAIPSRGLFVFGSRGGQPRGPRAVGAQHLSSRVRASRSYPTVVSADRRDNTPMPWAHCRFGYINAAAVVLARFAPVASIGRPM